MTTSLMQASIMPFGFTHRLQTLMTIFYITAKAPGQVARAASTEVHSGVETGS